MQCNDKGLNKREARDQMERMRSDDKSRERFEDAMLMVLKMKRVYDLRVMQKTQTALKAGRSKPMHSLLQTSVGTNLANTLVLALQDSF